MPFFILGSLGYTGTLPKIQHEVKTLFPRGFLLDIFTFSLIIPPYPKNTKERDDVGNNSAKKQSQAEEGPGFQKKDEHRHGQGSHQQPQGQGKKASRRITNGIDAMPYAYRKSERIRKNTEFVATMKGKRLSADGLSLFYTRNKTGNFRVGISVSRKLANAVERNRLRRRIRDCITRVLKDHELGYDLVFVARQQLTTADFDRILKTVEALLQRTALRPPK